MSVSSTDTTFDNKAIEANSCAAPMSAVAKNRLRKVYRVNPKRAVNIYADSKMHLAHEMKYGKSMKAKLQRRDRGSTHSKAIADIEFKALVENYGKHDASFQDDIVDDYQAMQEDDDERTKEELRQNVCFSASARKGLNPYASLDTDNRGVDLKDIKSYLKSNKIFMNDMKEDYIMMIMLRASDYMGHRGKNYDSMLQSIKSQMKTTTKSINREWKFSNTKLKELAAKMLHNTDKLREMNIVKNTNNLPLTLQNYDFTRSGKWMSAADINQSIRSKEAVLSWLKKENDVYDAQLKKCKEERNAANSKSKILKKYCVKRPVTNMGKNTAIIDKNKIVRLTSCFQKYKVRTVDYSLAISPLNAVKSASNSKLSNYSLVKNTGRQCASPSSNTFVTERSMSKKHVKDKKSVAVPLTEFTISTKPLKRSHAS